MTGCTLAHVQLQSTLQHLFPAASARRLQQLEEDEVRRRRSSETIPASAAVPGEAPAEPNPPESPAAEPVPPGVAAPAEHVHIGVGCDACGQFPISGECWVCEQCAVERPDIGFDLCGACYASGRHLSGRFSQHHTAGAPRAAPCTRLQGLRLRACVWEAR